mmetsp:Transcript_14660/g.24328  ORF Transcript_14660/g.24328 Transcript_14660/m.24328 type:complete len:695 (+) Transcript_14660:42-2126(+)
MRGLLMAATLAPAYAHNSIENTFDILSLSLSNSIGYLLDVPINMGEIETFLAGKKINAPLSNPVIATASSDLAPAGTPTQQTLWGSIVVEDVVSYIAFEDTGAAQLYEPHMMEYRDDHPGACAATTSIIPSENTGAADELARTHDCLQDWHLDATGVKTTSFSNKEYDPRNRSWYIKTKAAKEPTWSDLYAFIQTGDVGISYSLPFYSDQTNSDSTLLGMLAFDLYLSDVEEVLADNNIQNVVQYIMSDQFELVATSVGESKVTSSGDIKKATGADNFIIRESAVKVNASDAADGMYYYYSETDDSDYVVKVTSFSEGDYLNWKIVMVTEEDHVPEMSVKGRVVLADMSAALDDLTQNTESLAYYLQYLSGTYERAPLSTPIVEDGATAALSSVTHQTLWGVMNSFPEVADVMLTYANKRMFHFHADMTRMFYREDGDSAPYQEYPLNADGSVSVGTFYSVQFDPTTAVFYTVATENAAFTPFFADPSDDPKPEIAFSLPFFSAPNVLEGVISTTLYLDDFKNVVEEFDETSVAYFILDEDNNLIASSDGEVTWDATTNMLIKGTASSNIMVSTASDYIVDNAINTDNTFILNNDLLDVEDMIISVHMYSDVRDLLSWKLVSAQYYDDDIWLSNNEDGEDDEVAEAAAIAVGVLLFVVIAAVVAMLVMGKLTFNGGSGETESLKKKSDGDSSKL